MTKLLALYKLPPDKDAFLHHYENVHLPLVKKIPGLQAVNLSRIESSPTDSTPPYFLIAEMVFADRAAFDAAMKSEENRMAGKDLMSFARGLVTLLVAESA
jgi:uncharacterized protein (TIGR02118 family)